MVKLPAFTRQFVRGADELDDRDDPVAQVRVDDLDIALRRGLAALDMHENRLGHGHGVYLQRLPFAELLLGIFHHAYIRIKRRTMTLPPFR